MRVHARALSALAMGVCTLVATGCGTDAPVPAERGLRLAVAPLSLPGIDDACYDFRVANAANQTVTSQGDPTVTQAGEDQTVAPAARATTGPITPADTTTICSSQFGNGTGGDVTYITPCDADGADTDGDGLGEQQNTVTLWVDGVYGTGGVDIREWQDPCGADANDDGLPDGCALSFTCEENRDVLVEFNFTIMRDANQGFFDVAVNFEDIFCSAKLDTCYGTGPADQRPMELLSGGDELRDPTAVFAFACTAGTAQDVTTTLLYGPVELACGQGTFPVDPLGGPGNASVTTGGVTLHYAVYRGTEALQCDGASCNKAYWNLAFDLVGSDANGANVALTNCGLTLQTTAHDGTGFANGFPTAQNGAYPYIDVDSTLTAADGAPICQKNPLNGTDVLRGAPSNVTTVYQGAAGGLSGILSAPAMCGAFNGTTAASTAACGRCTQPANPDNGTYASCADTASGGTCALTCSSGYTKSGDATCTLGSWDTQTCTANNACASSADCAAQEVCDLAIQLCIPGMKVFATSVSYNGNLGGTSGADAKCQQLATAAGLAGTYKAWISDPASSPSARFGQATIPYRLVNGSLIANDWADLIDGTLSNPINKTETGAAVPAYWLGYSYIRTATNTDGTYDGLGATCSNWTSAAPPGGPLGRVGLAPRSDSQWTQSTSGFCDDPWGLYCFEQTPTTNACAQPANPDNGTYASCADTASGDTCALTCSSGYTKSGDATCTLGSWDTQTCTANACAQPANPDNGTYASCANTASGGTCALTCSSGYTKSGDATCTLGAWDTQTCDAPACAKLATAQASISFSGNCWQLAPRGKTCNAFCADNGTTFNANGTRYITGVNANVITPLTELVYGVTPQPLPCGAGSVGPGMLNGDSSNAQLICSGIASGSWYYPANNENANPSLPSGNEDWGSWANGAMFCVCN